MHYPRPPVQPLHFLLRQRLALPPHHVRDHGVPLGNVVVRLLQFFLQPHNGVLLGGDSNGHVVVPCPHRSKFRQFLLPFVQTTWWLDMIGTIGTIGLIGTIGTIGLIGMIGMIDMIDMVGTKKKVAKRMKEFNQSMP